MTARLGVIQRKKRKNHDNESACTSDRLKTDLDQLRTRPQERRRVIDVLDDLHRTYDIELLRFLYECLGRRMPER